MARKSKSKNRYFLDSKLSEYRFLRILRAFADGSSAKSTAAATGVSLKTVNDIFMRLRLRIHSRIEGTLEGFNSAWEQLGSAGRPTPPPKTMLPLFERLARRGNLHLSAKFREGFDEKAFAERAKLYKHKEPEAMGRIRRLVDARLNERHVPKRVRELHRYEIYARELCKLQNFDDWLKKKRIRWWETSEYGEYRLAYLALRKEYESNRANHSEAFYQELRRMLLEKPLSDADIPGADVWAAIGR